MPDEKDDAVVGTKEYIGIHIYKYIYIIYTYIMYTYILYIHIYMSGREHSDRSTLTSYPHRDYFPGGSGIDYVAWKKSEAH